MADINSKRRSRRSKDKKTSIVYAVLAAAAVLCIVFVLKTIFGENGTEVNQKDYFGITDESSVALVINAEQSESYAKVINDSIYISYDTVWNEINSAFYVEDSSDTLYMALPSETLTYKAGDETGFLYKDVDGSYYISLDCVKQYTDADIESFENPQRVVIRTNWDNLKYATAANGSKIRTEASRSANIEYTCSSNEKLELILSDGDWSRVMSADGHVGYIKSSDLSNIEDASQREANAALSFERIEKDESISMAWDYIGRAEDNGELSRMMDGVSGLNVISPTWFAISDSAGNISSYADANYVQTAHNSYNLEVWACVGDYVGEDTSTGAILSSYENRSRCISSLIQNALTMDIDGINIDFEHIDKEYGDSYIEFLRELTQQAHMNNLTVSVDDYVPGYTPQYRRDAQNDIVDYIIMMGYDEHTAYTQEYGSVASITYVREGVEATLEEVSADKLVLAVPFYTRGWTVPFGSDGFTAETLFMNKQQEFIDAHGIELSWDDNVGQYTGSAEDENGRYYIWVEDSASLEKKLALVGEYSLAGASGWRLGMQSADIWDVWQSALAQ